MKRWEYRMDEYGDCSASEIQADLNQLAREGWEVVSCTCRSIRTLIVIMRKEVQP